MLPLHVPPPLHGPNCPVGIAAFFAVPALFPGQVPEESRTKALSLFDFGERGIATATGRATAREATILVLLLPFLILCFGIAVAMIAALT